VRPFLCLHKPHYQKTYAKGMRETQRGFIPLIVAVLLGLAAICGGIALTVERQSFSNAEIINDKEQLAVAATSIATTSEPATTKVVAQSNTSAESCDRMVFGAMRHFGTLTIEGCNKVWQTAVEAKQKESNSINVSMSSVGGSGGSVETYTPPVPVQQKQQYQGPTSAQIAGALLLCADARIAHICNQTFWDGYMTNAVFGREVDALVIEYQHQNEQARLAAQLQQQKNCAAWMDAISPLLAGMSPEASVNAQKSSMAACSGMQYDDTAYQMSEIKEDVEDLKEIACPPGNNNTTCIGL
jgi:hypothetical protein